MTTIRPTEVADGTGMGRRRLEVHQMRLGVQMPSHLTGFIFRPLPRTPEKLLRGSRRAGAQPRTPSRC
jgi:hypothetical protein